MTACIECNGGGWDPHGPAENCRGCGGTGEVKPPPQAAPDARALAALLKRIVKYATEDRAVTPGVTRLARAIAEAQKLLANEALLPTAPPAETAELDALRADNERLRALINTPQTSDWAEAVKLEAAHQRERWGAEHDAGKQPSDWFWLIGYLAGKALHSAASGNVAKALHHTVSTGAALANWHLSLTGADTSMRPGIDTPHEAERVAAGGKP